MLNLNGVATMVADMGQMFSYLMLAASVYLILRHFRSAHSTPYWLLVCSLLMYLCFGWAYYNPSTSLVSPLRLTNTYINSILIFTAIIAFSASLSSDGITRLGHLIRNIAAISALATLASPLLYQYYVHLPPSHFERMGGFFGNPNEAGIIGVLAVTLIHAFPLRNKLLQLALVMTLCVCVFLTLSKTAMSALVLVLAGTVFWSAGLYLKLALIVFGALGIFTVLDSDRLILMAVDVFPVALSSQQLERVLEVSDILAGRFNADTTTNRTDIWAMLLNDIWARFPAGGGLGSAHSYLGGYLEGDAWQGAHNTYLLILAEAGPLAFGMFITTLAVIAIRLRALKSRAPAIFAILAVLAVEMFSSHNALATRYSNVVLAFVCGLVVASYREARRQRVRPRSHLFMPRR